MEVALAHSLCSAACHRSLLGDPVLIGDRRSHSVHRTDKIDNLPPNGRIGIIGRVNAQTQERIALQEWEKRGIPSTTCRAPPIASNTVNERSRREFFARTRIAHLAQS